TACTARPATSRTRARTSTGWCRRAATARITSACERKGAGAAPAGARPDGHVDLYRIGWSRYVNDCAMVLIDAVGVRTSDVPKGDWLVVASHDQLAALILRRYVTAMADGSAYVQDR